MRYQLSNSTAVSGVLQLRSFSLLYHLTYKLVDYYVSTYWLSQTFDDLKTRITVAVFYNDYQVVKLYHRQRKCNFYLFSMIPTQESRLKIILYYIYFAKADRHVKRLLPLSYTFIITHLLLVSYMWLLRAVIYDYHSFH